MIALMSANNPRYIQMFVSKLTVVLIIVQVFENSAEETCIASCMNVALAKQRNDCNNTWRYMFKLCGEDAEGNLLTTCKEVCNKDSKLNINNSDTDVKCVGNTLDCDPATAGNNKSHKRNSNRIYKLHQSQSGDSDYYRVLTKRRNRSVNPLSQYFTTPPTSTWLPTQFTTPSPTTTQPFTTSPTTIILPTTQFTTPSPTTTQPFTTSPTTTILPITQFTTPSPTTTQHFTTSPTTTILPTTQFTTPPPTTTQSFTTFPTTTQSFTTSPTTTQSTTTPPTTTQSTTTSPTTTQATTTLQTTTQPHTFPPTTAQYIPPPPTTTQPPIAPHNKHPRRKHKNNDYYSDGDYDYDCDLYSLYDPCTWAIALLG